MSLVCVCLVAGGGATPTARANGLVRRTRASAIAAGAQSLVDVRDLQSGTLGNRKLVVLVHGLFSTDVGTFGHLETMLSGRPDVFVAGFAHDTVMTSISQNGRDLAQAISALPEADVRLVCHSRGGLVARSAAVQLARGPAASQQRVRRCATFGTPHRGASLAEGPGSLVAATVIGQLLRGSRSGASVLDALSCWTTHDGFPGISDVAPPVKSDGFLAGLESEEGLFPNSLVNQMFVVGGAFRAATIPQRVMSRVLDGLDHDLIVPTDSSLPRLVRGGTNHRTSCDHFSYFGPDQQAVLADVVTFLTAN